MNVESELVFIVGPGSAGKTTTGKLLAEKLSYGFIDVDQVFNSRIAPIPEYAKQYGYPKYCEANSQLVDELLEEFPKRIVMPLPAGFLTHEESPELVLKHIELLKRKGTTIMLMPSKSIKETRDIIVSRQVARGYHDTYKEREERIINGRHPLYMTHGDIQIFSTEQPNMIVEEMIKELAKLGIPKLSAAD